MFVEVENHVSILCSSSCFVMEIVSKLYKDKGLTFKSCPLPSMIYLIEKENNDIKVNLDFGPFNVRDIRRGSWIEYGMFRKVDHGKAIGFLLQDTSGLGNCSNMDFYYIEDVEKPIYRLRIPLLEGFGNPKIHELHMPQMGDLKTKMKNFVVH